MPIEFRCPSCSKLLRTPDESAGKKAKCPQCGTIADVPLSSSGVDAVIGPGSISPTPRVPNTEDSAVPPPKPPFSPGPVSAVNPYASSSLFETPVAPSAPIGGGEMTPTKLSFDRVLNTTWQLFSPQMGPLAIAGLVVFGLYILIQVVNFVSRIAAEQTNEPVIVIGVVTINTFIGIAYQIWVQAGMANLMLKFTRGAPPKVSDLFAIGPFMIPIFLWFILYTLMTVIPLGLLAAPGGIALAAGEQEIAIGLFIAGGGVWVAWIIYLLVTYLYLALPICFIIDRKMSVMQSMRESRRFMKGNKLTAFLLMLVTGIVGGLFMCVTCSIGQILYIPYSSLLAVVVYLTITGQPISSQSGFPK